MSTETKIRLLILAMLILAMSLGIGTAGDPLGRIDLVL